jgi:hypothetical protein
MRSALLLLLSLLTCIFAQAQQDGHKTRNRLDDVSGHYILSYSNVSGSLDALLLPKGRIRFRLLALLQTGGESPRNGMVEGTVSLKNDTAVYKEETCQISMKFVNNKVIVREQNVGDCGFGAYVTAQGTYIRKARKPKFD